MANGNFLNNNNRNKRRTTAAYRNRRPMSCGRWLVSILSVAVLIAVVVLIVWVKTK